MAIHRYEARQANGSLDGILLGYYDEVWQAKRRMSGILGWIERWTYSSETDREVLTKVYE